MNPRTRRILGAIGVAALVTIALGLGPRVFGRKRLRFPYWSGALAPADYQALAAQPGWSASAITVAPGIRLNGLVRIPSANAAASAPWLLYFPGNDATQLQRGQAILNHVAEGRDWGLAVFAYRGYESSSGTPLLSDLAADAPAIVEQLCAAQRLTPERVHLIGFSIGGHLAVRAADALARAGQAPASLSLLAPADDIVMVRPSWWSKLDPGDDFQTRPFLDGVRGPVLVVQGGADEALGGPVQGKAVAEALGARARYVELPGVGHNVLIETPAAIAEVRGFIAAQSK